MIKTAKSKCREKIKGLLFHAKLYINRRLVLRRIVRAVLAQFPALERRLKQVGAAPSSAHRVRPPVVNELANLPPRVCRIYADLKIAVEKRSKRA